VAGSPEAERRRLDDVAAHKEGGAGDVVRVLRRRGHRQLGGTRIRRLRRTVPGKPQGARCQPHGQPEPVTLALTGGRTGYRIDVVDPESVQQDGEEGALEAPKDK
jgi:hypothetical protein